ncbi:hypothetical protein NKH85_15760 [Mesorhizobium sp. M0924]|uniref:hypothetical protein n=1 Tax=unclassified Mesorhizobium TaxID=325217 RepID=UPI003337A93F
MQNLNYRGTHREQQTTRKEVKDVFGFGKKSEEKGRAKDLHATALGIYGYFDKVSGADALDFIESAMTALGNAYGDEPVGSAIDEDFKRSLIGIIYGSAEVSRQAGSVPRRLGTMIVAVDLEAQSLQHLDADLARGLSGSVIDGVQRKALAMISAGGGKVEGETDFKALSRIMGRARYTQDPDLAAALIRAVT